MNRRGGVGREVLTELVGGVRSFPRWRDRYVAWVQVAGVLVTVGIVWAVWAVASGRWTLDGQSPAVYAAGFAFLGLVLVALLTEAEARVTERWRERVRLAAEDAKAAKVSDGYVVAYALGGQPGQPGSGLMGGPFVSVAAVRADRWDLSDALWRFSVREAPGGGLVVNMPAGALQVRYRAQVAQLAADLVAYGGGGSMDRDPVAIVERFLTRIGARDLTSTHHQPPVV